MPDPDGAQQDWRDIDWAQHERTLQVAGAPVRFIDVGGPDHERVVVLLHGIAASWRWFVDVLPALSRRARVLAVDLPGFGGSAMPVERLTFAGMADAVADLVADLGLPAVDVVGHSMGSIVATRLAIDHPERIRRLVLTGGPVLSLVDLPRHPVRTLVREPRAVTTLARQMMTIGAPAPALIRGIVADWPTIRRVLMRGFVAHPERLSPDVVRQVMHELGAPGSVPALLSAFGAHASEGLERLAAPTRIIRGALDPLSPARDVERFVRIVPDASVVTLDDVGHWPHVEQPAAFVREVEAFLGEVRP